MLPDVDHMDVGARQENLAVRGEPILLQLCVVPAYALTIHKVQQSRNPFVQWKLLLFAKSEFRFELLVPGITGFRRCSKVQALSIKHLVLGCLEGVFALGQAHTTKRTLPHTQKYNNNSLHMISRLSLIHI